VTQGSDPPATGRGELSARLHAYARYVTLVADQLAALEQGDLARVEELTTERERVYRTLVQGAPNPEDDTIEVRVEFAELLAEALRELERGTAADHLRPDRFLDLHSVSLRALRGAELRRSGRRGQYSRGGPGRPRLDVRF
jgi:hypothetical protein